MLELVLSMFCCNFYYHELMLNFSANVITIVFLLFPMSEWSYTEDPQNSYTMDRGVNEDISFNVTSSSIL